MSAFRVIPAALLLTVLLASCGGGTPDGDPSTPGSGASGVPSDSPTATEEAEPTESPAPEPGLSAADRENLADAISSGNTAALEGYFADPVMVIIMASECCFEQTPIEAVSHLDYVTGAPGPWDFDLPPGTIDTWRSGWYHEQFTGDDVVGRASDGTVVSFGIEGDEITHVLMGHESLIMG